jgi:hypothetical protein
MLADQREDFPMRVSIKKTVVAAIAALGMATAIASMPTPAEAEWHGGGWGGGCWNCGWGWGGGWGWGWDPGWAIARRPCPSGSRSLRSRLMATVRVAGSGGMSGRPAVTILAGGLSTFATDRLRAVSSDDSGPG